MRLDVPQVLPKAWCLVLDLLPHTRRVVEAPHELAAQKERRNCHVRGSEHVAERKLAPEQLLERLRALHKADHQLRVSVEDGAEIADEMVRDSNNEESRLRPLHWVLWHQAGLWEEVGHELDDDSARNG
jgi:hypothetical protein